MPYITHIIVKGSVRVDIHNVGSNGWDCFIQLLASLLMLCIRQLSLVFTRASFFLGYIRLHLNINSLDHTDNTVRTVLSMVI